MYLNRSTLRSNFRTRCTGTQLSPRAEQLFTAVRAHAVPNGVIANFCCGDVLPPRSALQTYDKEGVIRTRRSTDPPSRGLRARWVNKTFRSQQLDVVFWSHVRPAPRNLVITVDVFHRPRRTHWPSEALQGKRRPRNSRLHHPRAIPDTQRKHLMVARRGSGALFSQV